MFNASLLATPKNAASLINAELTRWSHCQCQTWKQTILADVVVLSVHCLAFR